MSAKQWGHGWHKGHKAGEQFGELVGRGGAEVEFGRLADRLELLARGLSAEANGPDKSGAWWALYAAILAKNLHEISAQLPGVLAAFSEQLEELPNAGHQA